MRKIILVTIISVTLYGCEPGYFDLLISNCNCRELNLINDSTKISLHGYYYDIDTKGGSYTTIIDLAIKNYSFDTVKINFNQSFFSTKFFDMKLADYNDDPILPHKNESRGVQFVFFLKKGLSLEKLNEYISSETIELDIKKIFGENHNINTAIVKLKFK